MKNIQSQRLWTVSYDSICMRKVSGYQGWRKVIDYKEEWENYSVSWLWCCYMTKHICIDSQVFAYLLHLSYASIKLKINRKELLCHLLCVFLSSGQLTSWLQAGCHSTKHHRHKIMSSGREDIPLCILFLFVGFFSRSLSPYLLTKQTFSHITWITSGLHNCSLTSFGKEN